MFAEKLREMPRGFGHAGRGHGRERAWGLEGLAGRLVELTGGGVAAGLSLCAPVVVEAQRRGGLVAWVGGSGALFFPPDFAACGIDLAALPILRMPDALGMARAAETLLRTGSFTLILMDLPRMADLPVPVQSRLVGLAQAHHAAILCITGRQREGMPVGSLVSFRGEAETARLGFDCFECTLHAAKDKRGQAGWTEKGLRHGTDGLC